MTAYEDVDFDLYNEDDTQDVTCRMCCQDCTLAYMTDGLCPGCVSLCASAPVKTVDPYTRRAHLVSLTRKAFVAWGEATSLRVERMSAIRPSQSCIEEAAELARHRERRYTLLETRLADETGLSASSILREVGNFPACSRLLRAGL